MDDNTLVCVTGSRGLLGSAFVDYCRENKIRYQTLLPFPCSMESLREVLIGGKVTHFVNCAGFANNAASVSSPYECYKSNVLCVLNQLESLRNFSPKTKYVNFGSIYEDSYERETPYSSSKRISRELLRTYRANYDISTFQATLSFTEYYREGADRMLVKIIRKLIEAKKVAESGFAAKAVKLFNSDDRFNFTWASDVVEHCFIEMENDEEDDPYLFNCESFSLGEIAGMITDELGLSRNLVEFTSDENNGRQFGDDRANSFIGKVGMQEIVKKLVEFELRTPKDYKFDPIMDRHVYGKPT